MALQTGSQWTAFFEGGGISQEAAADYTKIFTENCLTEQELPDIDKDGLRELGITVYGHVLAILRIAKPKQKKEDASSVSSTSSPANNHPMYKPPSVATKLPEIPSDMTHPQFRKFRIDWDVYKQITGLPDEHIANHLYSACCSDVQTSLINTHQDWLKMSEEELLVAIQLIVTKQTNPAVHRINFRKIVQQEGETVKEFTVRLRSAAIDCEFTCPSPTCKADISTPSIQDQFISGLNNDVLQTDILAKADLVIYKR